MNDEVEKLPKTVDEAVGMLIGSLSMKEKTRIANMPEGELIGLNLTLGMQIRNEFKMWGGNYELIESCCRVAGKDDLEPDNASFIIIMELWDVLQTSDSLRVVK